MEALNENNVVLSMPMFKNNKGYVLDKVIEGLRVYWELDVTDIEGDDELATFKVGDELVAISMMPVPIPNSEFESMYSYSYLWENVENETKEHTNHVIVSILSSDIPMVEKYSLLTKVNSSILRTSEDAIGIYQGSATLLLPKELYVAFSELLLSDMLPIQLWIYIGIICNNEKTSIYSYGMQEFDKSEIEILETAMPNREVYDLFINILNYVLAYDVTLKHGETIGFSEDEKIKIIESEAVYVDGNSLKLEI